jgi:hypothetical protein
MEQPRIMEIPGIPGKVQEMTLDQYMGALNPDHLARRQLEQIRSTALEAMGTTQKLLRALEKVGELEAQIEILKKNRIDDCVNQPVVEAPPPVAAELYRQIGKQAGSPFAPGGKFPRVKCPNCEKDVSTSPGAWHSHQKNSHGLTGVPIPKT